MSSILSQILDLSPAERIRLAQDIWDSVSEVPGTEILTEWQKAELTKRLEKLEENPNSGIPWRDAMADLTFVI